MSLNIKHPKAHQLARQLAEATGKTLTDAVIEALEARLLEIGSKDEREKRLEMMKRIAHECASRLSPEVKNLDIDELLYDEMGLPK